MVIKIRIEIRTYEPNGVLGRVGSFTGMVLTGIVGSIPSTLMYVTQNIVSNIP